MLGGHLNIARFRSEKEYDRHVNWLYQVRFNHPDKVHAEMFSNSPAPA